MPITSTNIRGTYGTAKRSFMEKLFWGYRNDFPVLESAVRQSVEPGDSFNLGKETMKQIEHEWTDVASADLAASGRGENDEPVEYAGNDRRVYSNIRHVFNEKITLSRDVLRMDEYTRNKERSVQRKTLVDAVVRGISKNVCALQIARHEAGGTKPQMAGLPAFSVEAGHTFGGTNATAPTTSGGTSGGYPSATGNAGTATAFGLAKLEDMLYSIFDDLGYGPDACVMGTKANRLRADKMGTTYSDRMRLDAPNGKPGRVSRNVSYVDYEDFSVAFFSDPHIENGTADALMIAYCTDHIQLVAFDGWGLKVSSTPVTNPGTETIVVTSETTLRYDSPKALSIYRGGKGTTAFTD